MRLLSKRTKRMKQEIGATLFLKFFVVFMLVPMIVFSMEQELWVRLVLLVVLFTIGFSLHKDTYSEVWYRSRK